MYKSLQTAIRSISHFQRLEQILAITLITIPGILWLVSGDLKGSISEYVLMDNSFVYGSLLTTAAMLYIFTGVLYYKDPNHIHKGQLFNLILGLLLLLIVFVPCNKYELAHYIIAILFFAGNAAVVIFKSSKLDRTKNWIVGILILIPFLVYFILKWSVAPYLLCFGPSGSPWG